MSSQYINDIETNVKIAHTYNSFCKVTWINGDSKRGWVVDPLVEVENEDRSISPAFTFITTDGAIGGITINNLLTHFQQIKCVGYEDKLGQFAAAFGKLLLHKSVEVNPEIGSAILKKVESLSLPHHVNIDADKTTIRLKY